MEHTLHRRIRRASTAVAIAVCLSPLSAPGVAGATAAPATPRQYPPGEQGPGIEPGYDVAAFNAKYSSPEKEQLAAELGAAQASGDPAAIERAIADDRAYLEKVGVDFSTVEPQLRQNLLNRSAMVGAARTSGSVHAASNPLSYSYQFAESPDYYCGPATALQIVATHGDWYAVANGAPANEPNLAYLLGTTTAGTSWSPPHMAPILNWWELGATTGYYIATGAPSTYNLYTDTSLDINNNHEVAINIHESSGAFHITGHPFFNSIYHWASLDGYDVFGRLRLVDPVYGSSIGYAPSTVPYDWYAASDLQSTFDGVYGIVW